MSTEDIKTKYGIDTTDFKNGINQMNLNLRTLESEFRANAAGMGDWDKTTIGLITRNKSLNDQIELQRLKVQTLKSEWERQVAATGESSEAARGLEIRLNNATGALNKMEAEVKSNTQTMAQNLVGGFKKVGDGIAAGLKTAAIAVAGLATAAVGIGASVVGLVINASGTADALVEMSDKTGLSTTRLQELQYISGQVGTDMETITGSMAKLTRSMASAEGGSGAAADAFKALGVNVTDANGNLLTSEQVFNSTIDALGKIQNPTERDALAMDIFGKSAQELNPLIKAGSASLNQMAADANAMGAVMGEDNVSALADFSDRMDGMKKSLSGTLGTLAGAFLPVLDDLLKSFNVWIREVMPKIQAEIPKLAAWVTGTLVPALGALFAYIQTNVIPTLIEVWNWLATNLPPAIAALSAFWTSTLQPALAAIWTFVTTSLIPAIVDIYNWIATNLPPVIQALSDIWNTVLLPAFTAIADFISTTLIPIISDIYDWIATNLPPVIQTLSDLWNNTLLPAFTAVYDFVQKNLVPLFTALAELFSAAFSLAVTAMAGLWQTTLLPAFMAIGDYLDKTLTPIFASISDFMSKTLGPAFDALKVNILDPVAAAFGSIGSAVQVVIGWIEEMTAALKKITLPDWLTPGSPTPFENGLVGISKAMNDLSRNKLPEFSGQMGLGGRGAAGAQTTIFNLTAQYGYQSQASLVDTVQLLNMLAR